MGANKLLSELNSELETINRRKAEIPDEINRLTLELSNLSARSQEISTVVTFMERRKSGQGYADDLDDLIIAANFMNEHGSPIEVLEDVILKLKQESMSANRGAECDRLIRNLENKVTLKRDFPMIDRYRKTNSQTETRDASPDAELTVAVRAMARNGVDTATIGRVLNVAEVEVLRML